MNAQENVPLIIWLEEARRAGRQAGLPTRIDSCLRKHVYTRMPAALSG
jgi:hypothetical protein